MPIFNPAGALPPNHVLMKLVIALGDDDSIKIADSPAARLATPLSATAPTGDCELSSIFQPVRSTVVAPKFVTSNQSAPTGLSPLDHGATSVIRTSTTVGPSTTPGEPVSVPLADWKAPSTPTVLNVETVGSGRSLPPRPA